MLLCPSSISTAQRRLPRKACFSAPLPSAPRRGGSPEKHAPLPLCHQHRAEEAPQKSMLLCPSSISTAQRRLPRKACFSAPLPSAPRRGGSPVKHAPLPLCHHHRAEEAPQKSMLLCPSSISTAQRRLPRKACSSAPLPSAPRRGGSPEKHTFPPLFHQHRAAEAPQKSMLLCPSSISTAQRRLPRKACFSAPLGPSAPRSGGSPEKHAPLPLFHQHRAEEAPQKSMLLCPSSISTAQRRLPRKAYISAPLPSEPRSRGGSPEKHASLPLFHQHRAEEAPRKSMLLCPSSISTAQRRLPRGGSPEKHAAPLPLSAPLPSAPRRGGSPEKHASMPLFHQHRAEEAPQKSMLLCPSSIRTAQRRLPRKACFSAPLPQPAQRRLPRKAYISSPLPSAPRSGGSPEKHAPLPLFHQHRAEEAPQKSMLDHQHRAAEAPQKSMPLFHQHRAEEAPQKSMLLCPSSISTAQRRLPRKACFSAPLPSAPRRGGSPEKHAPLPLCHQHRAEEAPQKSMLLCPSSISTAQRRLPRKACFYAPLPSAPRRGGSPEKHASLPPQMLLCPSSISTAQRRLPRKSTAQRRLPRKACFSAPLPSAPRRGGSPEKHAPLPLFHQHRAEEAPQKSRLPRKGSPEKHASLPLFHQHRAEGGPQKSMLLCPSSISTAQRRLPRKACSSAPLPSVCPAQRRLPRKAYISSPLPSAPRSGGSPEKHAPLPLFHQHRAEEAPQKSMLLCPSWTISTAQRRLPRKACSSAPLPSAPRRGGSPEKACFSAPLPSAPRREGSPEKHTSLPLFHQNRAVEEAPQKSMLLCPSSISTAQRRLPRKACFSAPLPSAPRRGGSPEKHTSLPLFHQHRAEEAPQKSMLLCPSSISTAQRRLPRKACFSAPLPSAPRRGGSPEKHAPLPLFHQHRAEEAPQKSMLLCPSSISTAQRRLPIKACFYAPLPSAPRRGGSPEKHASLPLFHQHRAEEAPQKSIHLCPSSISTAQRRLPRKACFSAPLPSAPRRGGSPEKHASLPLFHQHRAEEAPQKSMLLCPSSISTAQRRLPRKACFSAPLPSAPRRGGSP